MPEIKINVKKLSPKLQYLTRKKVILLLEDGMKPEGVAENLGISRSHVYAVKKSYAEKGNTGIEQKKRGRRVGEKRKLTLEQEMEIQKILWGKCPDQLKLSGYMWTRDNIGALIKRDYDISLPSSTLGYYLSAWGFSVPRRKQTHAQGSNEVKNRINSIAEQARAEKAEIFFGNETEVLTRGYDSIRQSHAIKYTGIKMLFAVSNRGKLRFTLHKDSISADGHIDFMQRLISDVKKKVFLILDTRVQRPEEISSWLAEHSDRIKVFYFDSSSFVRSSRRSKVVTE